MRPPIPSGISYRGQSDLGGTHNAFIFAGKNGHDYLLKDNGEDSIGRAEELASEIGREILGAHFIPPVWFVSTTKGTGALQPIVDNDGSPGADPPVEFFKKYADQIAMHQVLDWIISNHDSHGKQFLYGKNNNLIAVDKGQAFRFIGNDKLDYEYFPLKKYGEAPPIYNKLWKLYIMGKIECGLDKAKVALTKLDAISDENYKKLITKFVETRIREGGEENKKLWKLILLRKNTAEKDFSEFWDRVGTERKKMTE